MDSMGSVSRTISSQICVVETFLLPDRLFPHFVNQQKNCRSKEKEPSTPGNPVRPREVPFCLIVLCTVLLDLGNKHDRENDKGNQQTGHWKKKKKEFVY